MLKIALYAIFFLFTEEKVRISDMYKYQNCPLPSELASSVRKACLGFGVQTDLGLKSDPIILGKLCILPEPAFPL